ncbi:oligosaccharide flippase family protein [Sphingobacterium sp. E70]|uniref:oligosaccharide flippase family protein n=1 Tax=Sphingobacterium sp. E70 TaxID=2853439 RepID=UPI00211CA287|nr:oligosaccharide flippase family protein [Sphingobacterium sp. E70]ULT28915.1 oligosaccharide flippase family protein [Sphingobacterium sp. E70]
MLAVPMALSPVIVLLTANFFLFKGRYKSISPSFYSFDSTLLRDIFQLGWKFFVIQLGLILVYNIDNLIITQLFGPTAVTTYNIAYRYFSVITMLSGIVMAPLWTAFGEAYRIEDHAWIKKR